MTYSLPAIIFIYNMKGVALMIHYIYCYTNLINNKQYIGQTNNLERRKKQHIQDTIHQHKGHENAYNQPIHQAMRKYGIDNFDIKILQIIETDNWDEVNKIESDFIKKLNTLSPNGYNLNAQGEARKGNNKSKLSQEEQNNIINDLKNKVPIVEISEKYNLSRSYISDINNGRCLFKNTEQYPLQQNRITQEEYLDIIDMIKNTSYSLREIARYFNRDRETIRKINDGKTKIVQSLYEDSFPIRKDARKGYTLKPVETIPG